LGEYKKAEDFLVDAEQKVSNGTSERFKAQVYVHLSRTLHIVADSMYRTDVVARKTAFR